MRQWHTLLQKIMKHGIHRKDRTGVGTLSLFAESMKFPNSLAFPAVTTKQLAFKQAMGEMACFIRGNHSLEAFHSFGCNVWDGNGTDPKWVEKGAKFKGDLGRIYGQQWRRWMSDGGTWPGGEQKQPRETDQLRDLITGIRDNPFGRRHIVTAWNPGELDQMCLPPCPLLFQIYVTDKRLDMCVYQRSCDSFLGLPFDIAGYAMLQRLIAREVGSASGDLTFFLGDVHIYMNHMEAVETVLKRIPTRAPTLIFDPEISLFDFQPRHVRMQNYLPHPPVRALLNV